MKDRKVIYINLYVNSAKETVKRKVSGQLEKKSLPKPIKAVATKVGSKIAAAVATPERVAAMMSTKLPEMLPQKLGSKGMTAVARNVFVEGPFAVFEVQIQKVDMNVLIDSQTSDFIDEDGDLEPATMDESLAEKILHWLNRFFELIGMRNKDRLEGDYLPRVVQRQMETMMTDMMAEKLETKGLDAEPTVLSEEKQARFFFQTLQELRKKE